jgi:hypothetical protein
MRPKAYSCGLDAALYVIGGDGNRQHDTIRPSSMDS